MKKSILFLLLTVALISCKKDDEILQPTLNSTEIEKLPPTTQIGANTAGCLLNGVAVVAEGDEWSEKNPHCGYDQGAFVLLFRQNITEGGHIGTQAVYITTNSNTILEENTKYTIKEQESGKFAMFYVIGDGSIADERYYTTTSNVGELYISKLDKEKNIISGTFWFDAVDSQNKKAEIREGRFDVVYQSMGNKN
ncbi:hypothetical protein H1R17_05045 [Flavobacterium sp. xlx-214]|uniref:DUF6252 family protein n=1 Tax=unclassified Flavobacterium TaxID=196869 RepID=UPI0013D3AD05|nr:MULTISPECIES: DUF6252 family protein [unclassified Flavobacterium]MBA5793568.1 hypothetical protein [Flavobacterium sp. xlx-221]QMI84498.1 hypothetical protein H1R17_05045 [Flavobacterium sp. xlx-214]